MTLLLEIGETGYNEDGGGIGGRGGTRGVGVGLERKRREQRKH